VLGVAHRLNLRELPGLRQLLEAPEKEGLGPHAAEALCRGMDEAEGPGIATGLQAADYGDAFAVVVREAEGEPGQHHAGLGLVDSEGKLALPFKPVVIEESQVPSGTGFGVGYPDEVDSTAIDGHPGLRGESLAKDLVVP
jgi:hypothetical protein